jgi:hypothetical protein
MSALAKGVLAADHPGSRRSEGQQLVAGHVDRERIGRTNDGVGSCPSDGVVCQRQGGWYGAGNRRILRAK